MIYLTLEELLIIASRVIDGDVAVRDIGLLESAAARPKTSVFGEDAYPDLHSKAAAMLLSICLNHALIDGNKRLALAATIVMLGINGWELTVSNDDAYELVIAVAEGHMREVNDVAKALMAGSQRVS
jgi:death-on-curing protein